MKVPNLRTSNSLVRPSNDIYCKRPTRLHVLVFYDIPRASCTSILKHKTIPRSMLLVRSISVLHFLAWQCLQTGYEASATGSYSRPPSIIRR